MNCPKGLAEIEHIRHADIEVDRCTESRGLWFDRLESEKLRNMQGFEKVEAPATGGGEKAASKPGPAMCPACSTPMIQMVVRGQPHIQMESCTVCYSSFFDAGEFTGMKEVAVVEGLKAFVRG
jgi:Zn-finger nucleic acid-binding protein